MDEPAKCKHETREPIQNGWRCTSCGHVAVNLPAWALREAYGLPR